MSDPFKPTFATTGVVCGHAVSWDGECYRYDSDGAPVLPQKRPCPRCKKAPGLDGHDPCIAGLSGVLAACCGHGVRSGYIYFESGQAIYFDTCTVLSADREWTWP